jgi:4-hydroxyproline epimerase
LLLPSQSPDSAASVIFMNNVGYLGMCGHGAIGVAAALEHLGRLSSGTTLLDTPVGTVKLTVSERHVQIKNVPSYRYRTNVQIDVDRYTLSGDIAWGGNWFFITDLPGQELQLENVAELTRLTLHIRQQLRRQGITGARGEEIDHIELSRATSQSGYRNFVLCPGGQYDRSPCGTGTSAKLACLAADGKLAAGESVTVTSVVGSSFEGQYSLPTESESQEFGLTDPDANGCLILPTVSGKAYATAAGELLLDPNDPFCHGFSSTATKAVEPAQLGDDS